MKLHDVHIFKKKFREFFLLNHQKANYVLHLGHYVLIGQIFILCKMSSWAKCFLGHYIPLGILSPWAFCHLGQNVSWAFYAIGHFVIPGQNVTWAF